jgi:pimeloyl-ACP methyl ester carboxylesterase
VVGYTALTERDEGAAVRVRERHRELVQALVKQFDGEVVDMPGDESLSIFPSALRAVDCALALQGALRSHPDLRLRIGVHLGDVLRRAGEVIGEGVNVAARIRPLAEPGGICISEPVFQMVRSRAHLHAHALGPKAFKNVGSPLAVYALSATDPAAPTAPLRRRSRAAWIAVLAIALAGLGLVAMNRAAAGAWLALNLPRVFGRPIEQQLGFATTSDGVRIAYATSGTGPPVVFVLGWITHLTEGAGSPLYEGSSGVLHWYSRDHLLVRYDGRGFGLSQREVTDFSLDARVRDLEAVVDALHLEHFTLYGYSAGGPTAVAYTARHPERVTHLVLAATFLGSGALSQAEDNAETRALAGTVRGLTEMFRTSWDAPATRAAMVELLAPEAGEVGRRVLMHFLGISGDGKAYAGFLDAMREVNVSEAARSLRVPTLVFSGTKDQVMPIQFGSGLAAAIPGARFQILEGAGHLAASISDPTMMKTVSEFLSDKARPSE